MNVLYAPWRQKYSISSSTKKEECVFCIKPQKDQTQDQFMLYKGKTCYVALNLYPYNAGHLLVIPYAHKANLYDLGVATQIELMTLIAHSSKIVETVLHCDGLNVGINCGKPSGGSVPDHIHVHVLPRWSGDTNFLPALADTKIISFDLQEIYLKLKPAFDALG